MFSTNHFFLPFFNGFLKKKILIICKKNELLRVVTKILNETKTIYIPPTKAPAGINDAIKLACPSLIGKTAWAESSGRNKCKAGPDQPMQVPMIMPPMVAENATKYCDNSLLLFSFLPVSAFSVSGEYDSISLEAI